MYRPPMDSDTESEDFDFYIKPVSDSEVSEKYLPSIHQDQINDLLYEAVKSGDKKKTIELWDSHYQFSPIDMPLRQGWSLLLYACYYGHLDIVNYLLEKGADVNKQIDSVTPLLLACDCENPDVALGIVEILLKSGAYINVSDRHGTTPLMNAVKRGYVDIVKVLIKHASLEAKNLYGNTALFIAVEKNNEELVRLLMAEGADINQLNHRGLTPKQTAEQLRYENIIDLFPEEEEVYTTPARYRYYTDYEDPAPTVFKRDRCPDYFQEIGPLLEGMKMEKYLSSFAKAYISLEEFLTISNKKMEEIGIVYPYERKIIQLGLFKFHGHPWLKKSINKINPLKAQDMFDLYTIFAGHLQQLIILKSSIKYMQSNEYVSKEGQIDRALIDDVLQSVEQFKGSLSSLRENIIQSFTDDRNPLQVRLASLRQSSIFIKAIQVLTFTSLCSVCLWGILRIRRNFH